MKLMLTLGCPAAPLDRYKYKFREKFAVITERVCYSGGLIANFDSSLQWEGGVI